MTQLRDDCFANDSPLLTAAAALDLLRQRVQPVVRTETIALSGAAGRVLASEIRSERDVPAHDNSAVDGYAFRADDLASGEPNRLRVAGRSAAGHPLDHAPRPGTAVRIFTGALMPEGCDTVAMQEDCTVKGDILVVPDGLRQGANRRRRGEDVRTGQIVLNPGRRLRPQDLGMIASVGRAEVTVYQRLRVAVCSTGDEVSEPGDAIAPGRIYDANRFMLIALLEGLGATVTDLGIVGDDRATIRRTLDHARAEHDLVVSSGGVSVGEEDHVRQAIEDLGSLHFWRLAIKPGRPLTLGQIGQVPFVGVPGNPVAAMVTFLRFVRPVVLRLAGVEDVEPQVFTVIADFNHQKKSGRREFLRGRLTTGRDGRRHVTPFPHQGAGILRSLVEADGLVELPEEMTKLTPGSDVAFLPFSEVLA